MNPDFWWGILISVFIIGCILLLSALIVVAIGAIISQAWQVVTTHRAVRRKEKSE